MTFFGQDSLRVVFHLDVVRLLEQVGVTDQIQLSVANNCSEVVIRPPA